MTRTLRPVWLSVRVGLHSSAGDVYGAAADPPLHPESCLPSVYTCMIYLMLHVFWGSPGAVIVLSLLECWDELSAGPSRSINRAERAAIICTAFYFMQSNYFERYSMHSVSTTRAHRAQGAGFRRAHVARGAGFAAVSPSGVAARALKVGDMLPAFVMETDESSSTARKTVSSQASNSARASSPVPSGAHAFESLCW